MSRAVGRFLVTGATGMVGRALVSALRADGHTVAGTGRHPGNPGRPQDTPHFCWDAGDPDPPSDLIDWQAQYLIHAAAMTDVDRCETHPHEAERANVRGTAHVGALADRWGARLIYLSTDSVFDGLRGGYADSDTVHPLNVYAATKARGEREALRSAESLVVRFNVIGPERLTNWILRSATSGVAIDVFEDVRFNPVEVRELAGLLVALALSPLTGICHLGSDEVISKAGYAERLVAGAGLSAAGQLRHVRLAARPLAAPRPLDTSLQVSDRVVALRPVPSMDAAIRRLAAEFVDSSTRPGHRPAHS